MKRRKEEEEEKRTEDEEEEEGRGRPWTQERAKVTLPNPYGSQWALLGKVISYRN